MKVHRCFASSCARWPVLPFLTALGASVVFAQPQRVQLPMRAHGSAAIAALGDHLPTVAKEHGMNPEVLVTLLQTQSSLGVDIDGSLFFVCKGLEVAESDLAEFTPAPDSSWEATVDSVTAADVFRLHSLPGVKQIIYLDFDGHTTSGTHWNSNYTNNQPIVSEPFSLDADVSTFSATEREFVRRVWQRVAEDFAPFRVNVTTEDPGVEALRRTDNSDVSYGIRVVISPTNWYGSGGGIGNVGSFTRNTDTPCYVFSANLANSEKPVAEACSHEVGHTLGLMHDGLGGSAPTEYYRGHGNWAPIMGNSYWKAVSQWSRGEYTHANNTQDDVAIIAGYVPLLSDDHGNTPATATVLTAATVATGGTIETRSDVDVFRVDSNAGAMVFTISGPTVQPNLDLKADLLDSRGDVVQTSDSSTSLGAVINATVPAGTYYLRIDGIGLGDPVTTGYSDYASLGNYVITGSFSASDSKQAPVAVLSASVTSGTAPLTIDFSGQNSTDTDGLIASYSWTFAGEAGATGVNPSYTYTSPGTYVAALTVTDNDGLSGTATVTIGVAAALNLPPTAVLLASTTSGTAPVPVNFSAEGSKDPDGSITAYKWDFGDGTSSMGAWASKIYTTPGKYSAKLTVTDDRGASSSSTVDVSVLGSNETDADVYSLTLTSLKGKNGTMATASVIVLDRKSRPVEGATVTLAWSGVVSGAITAKTDAGGRIMLTSKPSKKAGSVTAAVTSVAPRAGAFDNTIFSASLSQTVVFQ